MADETITSTIADAIKANASGPAKAAGDSFSTEQHSLQDQIAADRYLASKRAANQPLRGMRVSRIVPPGAA